MDALTKKIVKLYGTMNCTEIAEYLEMSRGAVTRRLKSANVQIIRNPPKKQNINYRLDITPEQVSKMYSQGMTVPSIADAFNCKTGTIYRRLRTADVKLIKRPRKSSQSQQKKEKPQKPIIKPGLEQPPPKATRKKCIRCGINTVPTKPVRGHILTRLCARCFEKGEDE